MAVDFNDIIKKLNSLKNPRNIEGMARFGIRPKSKVFGISIPELRKIAKEIKKDLSAQTSHNLAMKLFGSGIHEARLLAGFIAESEKLTEQEIEKWVKTFDSWDIVDQVCGNLFDKSKIAVKKISEFAKRDAEFEKRVAFALIAALSVHNKKMRDEEFLKFFPLIKKASTDERNFVKKAVNWALRQIGKRNKNLNKETLKLAKEIQEIGSKSSKWIAKDAIRELESEKIKSRLK
jgi:3-methyladenine DNA glycosylase AlkD